MHSQRISLLHRKSLMKCMIHMFGLMLALETSCDLHCRLAYCVHDPQHVIIYQARLQTYVQSLTDLDASIRKDLHKFLLKIAF